MPEPTHGAAADGDVSGSRERILAGARTRFLAHGFRQVTMTDLATELGMSKKTLYVHFPSKTALVEAIVESKLDHLRADLAAVAEAAEVPFPDRLQRLLAALRGHMAEIQPAFVRDVQRGAPGLFTRIRQGRREMIHGCFGRLLQEGRRAGAVRDDIPVNMLIEMLIGTVDAIVVPERVDELGITPRTAFAQIVTVFLEGALVRDGGGR